MTPSDNHQMNSNEQEQLNKNTQDSNEEDNNESLVVSSSIPHSDSSLNSTTAADSSNTTKIEVTAKDFQVKKLLGRGCYGRVLLVRKTNGEDNDRCFAMKIIEKSRVLKSTALIQKTKSERMILETVKHPFITNLKYAFQTKKRLYLLMEFCAGGDLFNRMQRIRRCKEITVRFYSAECILGLEYLHNKGIIYRDFKPENIMLDSEGHIKLTDFGLSKDGMFDGVSTKTYCGTLEYMAPEVVIANKDNTYGKAADWWSLGILMYEMFFGSTPFIGRSKDEIMHKILYSNFNIPREISISAETLIRDLLVKSASDRLGGSNYGADSIKSHPFFKNYDWNDVVEKKIKPPFKPNIAHPADTQYFAKKYTSQPMKNTPLQIDKYRDDYNEKEDDIFNGFSYTDPDYNQP